jgi:ribonuclease P protein component
MKSRQAFLEPSMLDNAKPPLGPARLRKHSEYQRTYRGSRKYFSPSMTYFFAVRTESPGQGPKIGITAGRVLGKAVDRNRIKRRLREAVRSNLGLLAEEDIDVVLHPRRSVLTLDWASLCAEISQIFIEIQAATRRKRAAT